MEIEHTVELDLLDTTGTPALSSTSDMPIVETKPDAQNEGAPPKAAPSEEEGKTKAESATAPEDEKPSASDEPKKAQGVQKRLDELTRQREDEKRRADASEAREARLMTMLEQTAGKPALAPADQSEADPEPVRPSRAGFQDSEAYEQAFMDYAEQKASWTAKREIRAAQAETQQKEQISAVEQAQQATREAYGKRVDTVKGKYADFAEVAESPDVQVSIPMAAAILHSENGPELQYYLGKNPSEAERIRQLAPPLQLLELGKIEAKLIAPATSKPAVSAAPAPIKPLAGASATASKDRETMSMEEYAAVRRAEIRAQVRH